MDSALKPTEPQQNIEIKVEAVACHRRLSYARKVFGRFEDVAPTGKGGKTPDSIARQLCSDPVLAEPLPNDKGHEVQKLMYDGKPVGREINGAPAPTQADVRFAVGAGTDVTIEASDIRPIKGGLLDLGAGIEMSCATMKNVRQNLVGGLGRNSLAIPVPSETLFLLVGIRFSRLVSAGLSSVTAIDNANCLRFLEPRRIAR